jgi:hypothetical protein
MHHGKEAEQSGLGRRLKAVIFKEEVEVRIIDE